MENSSRDKSRRHFFWSLFIGFPARMFPPKTVLITTDSLSNPEVTFSRITIRAINIVLFDFDREHVTGQVELS